ncbi:MAG TPA: hypothetical protein VNQ76_15305 [Planctomicrobium sp.]|nr:hypothetical protein [Planctomicrobium sp.]
MLFMSIKPKDCILIRVNGIDVWIQLQKQKGGAETRIAIQADRAAQVYREHHLPELGVEVPDCLKRIKATEFAAVESAGS